MQKKVKTNKKQTKPHPKQQTKAPIKEWWLLNTENKALTGNKLHGEEKMCVCVYLCVCACLCV